MITFSHPEYLAFLFAIPLMILIHIVSMKSVKRRAIKFVNFDAIKRVTGVEVYSKNLTVLYLSIIIVLLLSFALSGLGVTYDTNTGKNSFVVAIDSSRSMGADDIKPTRFDTAKKAAIDFLGMIPSQTRVGVVSFSGSTVIESEVTDNADNIRSAINSMVLRTTGGTDVLNALITSSNLLRLEKGKAIILMSDGGINVNSLQEIIDYASKNNVIIYCLGIGTELGGSDESGAVFKISTDVLKMLAENTGGRYYQINNLDDFYSSLNSIVETAKSRTLLDLSNYLLMAGLILIVLNFFIINNKFRSFP
jgi:Ca-activated chloride channel family protein